MPSPKNPDPATGQEQPYVPTTRDREMVRVLASYGVPQDDICVELGITKPTLHKHFRRELDTAMVRANARVAQSLYQKATARDLTGASVTAAIFWLKCRAGWKEARPLDDTTDYDLDNASTDTIQAELDAIRSRKRAAAGTGTLAPGMSGQPPGVVH